jgi:hypothetical protein
MQDGNQPAFPATSWTKDGDFLGENQGMSLRDYFAAKAMQGLYASSFYNESYAVISEMAYKQADAMLKARQE